MSTNKGLSRKDLWEIAAAIVEKQKKSEYIDGVHRSDVNWEDVEDDWFDALEDLVFTKNYD